MKSTFVFKLDSSEKMIKTSKFVSQKQNKTKQKLTSNNKNNNKRIRMFDVRPLHCNFCFFLQQKKQQELYCAKSTNIMLKKI